MTLKDVALRAGVSYTTVSHVINGTRKVSAEAAERVTRAVHELGYEPNASARSLKRGTSGIIGVMTIKSVDPYFAEVLSGIESACSERGFGMILCHSECESARELENLRMLKDKGVDALIVNSLIGGMETMELLRSARQPVLILQSRFEDGSLDCMHSDDRGGARDAVRHLIGLGHERIAFVSGIGMGHHTALERGAGWREALAEAGLPIDEGLWRISDYSHSGGHSSAMELLCLAAPPTAIFAASDSMAMGVLRALADSGLSCPAHLSVIGYDDLPFCGYCQPRLSSVRHPGYQLGQAAFARIAARLSDPGLPKGCLALPASLVLRESTGPASRPNQAGSA